MMPDKRPFPRYLGTTLHDYFDAIANEPLPKRWVDLINHLNELERSGTAWDEPPYLFKAERHRRPQGS